LDAAQTVNVLLNDTAGSVTNTRRHRSAKSFKVRPLTGSELHRRDHPAVEL